MVEYANSQEALMAAKAEEEYKDTIPADWSEMNLKDVKISALCKNIRAQHNPSRTLVLLCTLIERLTKHPSLVIIIRDWEDIIGELLKNYTCGRVLRATCALLALLCQLQWDYSVFRGSNSMLLQRGVLHRLLGIVESRLSGHAADAVVHELLTLITALLLHMSLVIPTWPSNLLDNDINTLLKLCSSQTSPAFCNSVEGADTFEELTAGKSLIGQVSQMSENDSSHIGRTQLNFVHNNKIYMNKQFFHITLFDTTHPENDVNISESMVECKAVWSSVMEQQMVTNNPYQDICVSCVLNGCTFWAHVGGKKVMDTLERIQQILTTWPEEKKLRLRRQPLGGEFVCGITEGIGHCRAQVVAAPHKETLDQCLVFLTDHGAVVNMEWRHLWLQEPEMGLKAFVPQATLCQMQGVMAAPSCLELLSNTLEVLINLSGANRVNIGAFPLAELPDQLLYLCLCGEPLVQARVLQLFGNLSVFKAWKVELGRAGLVSIICDICAEEQNRGGVDELVMQAAFFSLNNLLFDCPENKAYLKASKGLLALLHLYWKGRPSFRSGAIRCLRTFVGNAIIVDLAMNSSCTSIFPRSVVEMPSSTRRSRDSSRCSTERSQSCSRSRSCSRSHRSSSGGESGNESGPGTHSLTQKQLEAEEELRRLSYGCETSDYNASDLSDAAPDHIAIAEISSAGGYVFNGLVSFTNDKTHEIRGNKKMEYVSSKTTSKIVCGFLNQGIGGTIYFGINENSRVMGVDVDRDVRDQLRIGIDKEMGRIVPAVMPSLYNIIFKKVHFCGTVDIPFNVRPRKEHYHVIELRIAECSGTTYTYKRKVFMRKGYETHEISLQELHAFTVAKCEHDYLEDLFNLNQDLERLQQDLGRYSFPSQSTQQVRESNGVLEKNWPSEPTA